MNNSVKFEWVSLAEVASSKKFAIVDGPFGSSLKASDYVPEGIPVLQGKNISNNCWEWKDIRYISKKKAEELKRSSVEPGDLLIVKIGSIGYSAIIPDLNGHSFAIIPANLAKVTLDENKVLPKYIWHWMTSERAVNTLKGIASKTAQPALSLEKLKKFKIPLPPLPEQKRIAALLDEADRQRALARQQLAEFDKLAEAVFVEMFGDPVRNEMGWDRKPLGALAQIKLGKMLDASKQTHLEQFYYLGNANVQWGRFELSNLKTMGFAEKDRVAFQLLPGDLLMCEGGEVGRCAIWKGEVENCFYQKAIHRIRTNAQILSAQFLQSQMQLLARLGGLKDYVTVATIAHLTAEKLTQLPIILPPISLQEKYANAIASIIEELSNASLIYDNAETLFQSLMHQSFGAN